VQDTTYFLARFDVLDLNMLRRLFAILLAAVLQLHLAHAQTAPPPLPVTVAPPLSKRITTWDEFSGRFQAVERVEVRPRVSGFIEQVHFKDRSVLRLKARKPRLRGKKLRCS
jgi:multidrug efflux pump subunit AcrA (membrane-fusion protein)